MVVRAPLRGASAVASHLASRCAPAALNAGWDSRRETRPGQQQVQRRRALACGAGLLLSDGLRVVPGGTISSIWSSTSSLSTVLATRSAVSQSALNSLY